VDKKIIDHSWIENVRKRPGFLIRLLHQKHTAIFNSECRIDGLTPMMFSILSVLTQHDKIEQTKLAKLVAIDKTNIVDALKRLSKMGYVSRERCDVDKRKRYTRISEKGQLLVERMNHRVLLSHKKTLLPLSDEEKLSFVHLLEKLLSED
jgi:DNA-binding MarR family transcriptional regulator